MNIKKEIKEFLEMNKKDDWVYHIIKKPHSLFLFMDENTKQIMFDCELLEIPPYAYENYKIEKVFFNKGLKQIGRHAFANTKIQTLYISNQK